MSTRTDNTAGPSHQPTADWGDPEAAPPSERVLWPLRTVPSEGDASDKDAIVIARELAQHRSIERLQRWVEALEAAAAADPVMASSPL